MFGKEKTTKKSPAEKFIKEFIKNNYLFEYRRPSYPFGNDDSFTYEIAVEITDAARKVLKENSIPRVIHMDYTGFTDGSDNVDYLLNKCEISNPSYVDGIIFNGKITDTEIIKDFLNRKTYEYDCLNFYLSGEMWEEIRNFHVDISTLNGNIDSFKKEFLEEHEETEYGIKRNGCACVGYDWHEFICKKEDVYYNLSIIYDFINKFKEYLLLKNKFVDDILSGINSIEDAPYILNNKELLIKAIAYNKSFAKNLTKDHSIGIYATKNIVLKAIEENSNCYKYIDTYYQRDNDVLCKALDEDLKLLSFIIETNGFDTKKIKEKIKEVFTGK